MFTYRHGGRGSGHLDVYFLIEKLPSMIMIIIDFFTVFQPCTHKVVLPSDACNCKLSKEEMGDFKTTSQLSLKCESLIL